MKRISKEMFVEDEKIRARLIGDILEDLKRDPKIKKQLTREASQIILDRESSMHARGHSMYLLGTMEAESAVEPLIEMLDKPVTGEHEKRMPFAQADAFTALVMIGKKALPVLKEKIDSVSESKLRNLVSAIYHISKETSFIKKKISERIKKAEPQAKIQLEKLLQDINTWK